MSNLLEHAKRELLLAGYIPLEQEQEDGPNKWIQENLLHLLEVFSEQGHSGSSAPYCISLFSRLAGYKVLTPLTGEDGEWNDTGDGRFQNKRCSHVFKNSEGYAYDIQGRIFREKDGTCFTNGESRTPVVFPYTPKSEYIDAP